MPLYIDKDMYIMLIITEYTTICMSVLLNIHFQKALNLHPRFFA